MFKIATTYRKRLYSNFERTSKDLAEVWEIAREKGSLKPDWACLGKVTNLDFMAAKEGGVNNDDERDKKLNAFKRMMIRKFVESRFDDASVLKNPDPTKTKNM